MITSKSSFRILAALLVLLAVSAYAKKQELPEVTSDGLHRVPDSKLAVVYAEPGADLAPYQRVNLLDAYVAFKKNWARDQRSKSAQPLRINSKDMEKIKDTLSAEFKEVFRAALVDEGFELTEETADDVMIVRPAIINLDVNAPDTMSAGRTTTYVASAGEMTLYIELYDSVSGDIFAKALDRRVDNRHGGYYTWANSVTNRAAADRILKGWAGILVDALKEAKSYNAGTNEDS
ncbi:DUF3313 family protein [Pseudomonadota bacterium]